MSVARPALILLVAVFVTGCSNGPTESKSESESTTGSQTQTADLLSNALDMLQPERLGVSSDYGTALAVMNDWLADNEEQIPAVSVPQGELESLVSGEVVRRVEMERFVARDCDHVRLGLLCQQILRRVQTLARDDQGRVIELFRFVNRHVVLVSDDDRVPLSPYDALMFGQGTAADRAWLFAEFVRQLRLDCVWLQTSDNPLDGLVGVCLGADLLLFDPVLGIPLPSTASGEAGSEQIKQSEPVLTWSDLQDLTEWPESLRTGPDAAYRLTLSQIRESKPQLIAQSELWSARMKRLQTVLTGERDLVVYRPVVVDGAFDGARDNLLKASNGLWTADQFGIWGYPDQQLASAGTATDEVAQKLRRLQLTMAAPLVSDEEQEAAEQFSLFLALDRAEESGTRNTLVNIRNEAVPSMLKMRVMQLQGQLSEALQLYQSTRYRIGRMRSSAMSGEVLRAHQLAAGAATFWIATCQMDEGEWESAANSLRQYRRLYPTGKWSDGSRLIEADCRNRAGQTESAATVLSEVSDGSPQAPAAQFWKSQLQVEQPES